MTSMHDEAAWSPSAKTVDVKNTSTGGEGGGGELLKTKTV